METYVKVYGIKMAERIHWKRLENALLKYGKRVAQEMKDTLTKQDHIDTGKLRGSIKEYVDSSDEAKLALYVTFTDYGQYADRWFEKKSIRTITKQITTKSGKARTIRTKTGIRPEDPTFIGVWYDNVAELNFEIEDAARDDLEETIYNYIKNK